MRSRYSRWDGTQDPFGPDLDIGDLLDEISDDVLSGFGPQFALRRLMRQGISGRINGLEDLARRLREQRRRLSQGLNLEGPLAEVKDKLDEILATERAALAEQDSEDARMRETFLDTLPGSPAGAIKELMDYQFASPEAQQKFKELVESIQREVLGTYFRSLSGAMQGLTPQDVARMREMIGALNEMIAARERGDSYDFEGFMQKYGDFFPENPRNLDELLEVLARRMAAMSRLLASLSPEQRRELQQMVDAVMGDMDLAFQMDQLGSALRDLMPYLPWDESMAGWGDEPMPLAAAVDTIDRMSELEELEQAAEGDYAGSSIDDVDEEKLRSALGEDAVRDVRRLKQIEKALEEAGIITHNRGRIELTARGARRLGERALVKVFEDMRKERAGGHDNRDIGGPAEPTGATRPWRFGDVGEFAVQKTVFNAIVRSAGRPPGSSVKLQADDFELVEAETRTRTATALLLDLSFSMPLRGHWVPAKKMALALHALIEGKYPQDVLYLIGFSDYARKLEPRDLTSTGSIERVYGTNMQHAFLLARRLLSEHPRATKQVIMVTDGEPTAHLEDFGSPHGPQAFFSWPPVPETITKTLAEAVRLSQAGITLNVFMLEDSPGLVGFMHKLAQRTGGRVFQMADRDLGSYVLRDYVRHRR
jgi:uncharacterized protein with von Willebrand factor type A (vWA) domain